jgi:hypothetical protein
MQTEIGQMMLMTAVIATLLLILVVVFFRDRPLERIEINLEEDQEKLIDELPSFASAAGEELPLA